MKSSTLTQQEKHDIYLRKIETEVKEITLSAMNSESDALFARSVAYVAVKRVKEANIKEAVVVKAVNELADLTNKVYKSAHHAVELSYKLFRLPITNTNKGNKK